MQQDLRRIMSTPMIAPAEGVKINPEDLEIANAYLEYGSIDKICEDLEAPRDLVISTLERREVKAYIDRVYFDAGFNNRFKMNSLMETIIQRKLQELEEAGTTSNKDITEILALQHKMMMDHLNYILARDKVSTGPTNQTNIQINDASNHSKLIENIFAASTKR